MRYSISFAPKETLQALKRNKDAGIKVD